MSVTLYSTHCPKCDVLEKKLQNKGVEYQAVYDFDKKELIKKGFVSAPVLVVDDEYMDFSKANNWINTFREV